MFLFGILRFILFIGIFVLQEAECQKAAMDVRYQVDTKIANASREYQLQQANFDQEVNTKVGRA